MDIPLFKDLLIERIQSPLFVFQIFCCLLWCLDEYWYYSIFTLIMLIFFESVVVFQQRTNMTVIRKMQNSPSSRYVFRQKKWIKLDDIDLLPGDIISLKHSNIANKNNLNILDNNEKVLCPCDILLLHGTSLVDESTLTGESIPQIKEPYEKSCYENIFNIDQISKVHILSCGTTLLNSCITKQQNSFKNIPNPPDNGAIGLCLRTGFSTSKGRLLKTIMYNVNHVPNNNFETAMFLAFLSIFACIAASYVWIKGTQDPNRSRYKLILECILILTSVVPPELPIELSLAINSSMVKLFSKNIFCTEPFRIPFAGKLDFCCFDKTGTLTEENLIVEGVVLPDNNLTVTPLDKLTDMSIGVILGCHSLTLLNDIIVGDPLEKSALDQLSAKIVGSDEIFQFKNIQVKIIKRFPFMSKLKRMSSFISLSGEGVYQLLSIPKNQKMSHYGFVIKGAPEVLQSMMIDLPKNYDETYKSLTKNGYRVLALGFKYLSDFTADCLSGLKREDSEFGVKFFGFLVARCHLKPDTKNSICEIKYSGHKVHFFYCLSNFII